MRRCPLGTVWIIVAVYFPRVLQSEYRGMDKGSHPKKPWEYLNFEMEVRESARGVYSVRVIHSPEGEPHGEMRLPFPEGEIEDKLGELENALYSGSEETRSGKTIRRIDRRNERTVKAFGQTLFESLFDDRELFSCYRASLREAKR